MSAPFSIVDRYHVHQVTLHPHESIEKAARVCKAYRMAFPRLLFYVHGDNVDEGCPDGLSRDERLYLEDAELR